MKPLYSFWKKDILNKLIILVIFFITAGIGVDISLLMKPKSTGTSLLADLFPTPTTELKTLVTQRAETALYEVEMATASVPPTITTMPFTPMPRTATFTPTITALNYSAHQTTPTLQATATIETPGISPTSIPISGSDCIPDTTGQKGKAVDIIDGYTIKALIDGLVYTIRYLGIELPEDEKYAGQASVINGKLVFGKEIRLIPDGIEKDSSGRLLRYVQVGDTFVNLELIHQGLAITEKTDRLFSCSEAFRTAEQSARDAQRGIWILAQIP